MEKIFGMLKEKYNFDSESNVGIDSWVRERGTFSIDDRTYKVCYTHNSHIEVVYEDRLGARDWTFIMQDGAVERHGYVCRDKIIDDIYAFFLSQTIHAS